MCQLPLLWHQLCFKSFSWVQCIFGWLKIKITIYKCSFWLKPKSNTPFNPGSQFVGHVSGFSEPNPNTWDLGPVHILPRCKGEGCEDAGAGPQPAVGLPLRHQFLLLFTLFWLLLLVAPPLHCLHMETEVIVCLFFFFFLPVFMPHPSSAELTLLAFAAGAFAAALSAPSDPAFVLLRRARLPGQLGLFSLNFKDLPFLCWISGGPLLHLEMGSLLCLLSPICPGELPTAGDTSLDSWA